MVYTFLMTEGRGLFTEREREVLLGDGSDSYQSKTRSYIRRRIKKIENDAEFLEEHAPNLLAELRVAICKPDCSNPVFSGEHCGGTEYIFYKNGDIWNQDYYDSSKISWGENGGDTGKANTAHVLIRESLVENMSLTYTTLRDFIYEFDIDNKDDWEVTAGEIRRWFRDQKLSEED